MPQGQNHGFGAQTFVGQFGVLAPAAPKLIAGRENPNFFFEGVRDDIIRWYVFGGTDLGGAVGRDPFVPNTIAKESAQRLQLHLPCARADRAASAKFLEMMQLDFSKGSEVSRGTEIRQLIASVPVLPPTGSSDIASVVPAGVNAAQTAQKTLYGFRDGWHRTRGRSGRHCMHLCDVFIVFLVDDLANLPIGYLPVAGFEGTADPFAVVFPIYMKGAVTLVEAYIAPSLAEKLTLTQMSAVGVESLICFHVLTLPLG